MDSPAPCTPASPVQRAATQHASTRSGRRARRSSTTRSRKPLIAFGPIATCADPGSQCRRFAVLAAAFLLACCLPLLSACAPTAEHELSLKVFENGEATDSSEARIISAGVVPSHSWSMGASNEEITSLSVDFYLPATITSDETPTEVTYAAAREDVRIANPNAIAGERITLADAVDNPLMALLYQLQSAATAPSEALTVPGKEATDFVALTVAVEADDDALTALNEGDRALKADSLPPTSTQALVSQLSDGFITITAAYNDGSTVERTYALAVHGLTDEGEIASYTLTDITDR